MLVILGVILLSLNACHSYDSSEYSEIDSNEIDSNEINVDGFLSFEEKLLGGIDPSIIEDAKSKTPELIAKYGYQGEVHHVTTEDGYIIQLHRIVGGPKSEAKRGKKVCFLMHGMMDSSATWVLAGPHIALGYRLVDEGFDVWLGNARGNRYSANHTTFRPFGSLKNRRNFWSFSWHEVGVYDLPASIDYILEQTGETKLQYLGHSQGGTSFYVMVAERPEYNSKIEIMHSMGAAVFMKHVKSPMLRAIVPFISTLREAKKLIGYHYVAPINKFLTMAGQQLCRDNSPTQLICLNIYYLGMGYSKQLNTTLAMAYLGHLPAGASVNQLLHYGQEINSGHFRQFDYGAVQNLIRYKRLTPPDYDLNNVKVPVAVYYGKNDWLANYEDTQRLLKVLPRVLNDYLIPVDEFSHGDFVCGMDTPRLLYNEVVKTVKSAYL